VQIVIADRPAELAAYRIGDRLRDAIRRRGVATVALSGGSTAPSLIDALQQRPVAWASVTVWQVDERVAPAGDAARNANQLRAFGDLPCRVVRMPVEADDLRAAARRYASGLPERFDVVHLGVGDDGHTASWPPGRTDLIHSARNVEVVEMFNGWPRMTLTRRVVNRARCRVVVAAGASKRPMVEGWLLRDRELPIDAVRRTSTWVYLDPAAAPAGGLVETK
jgi:6-phosphogluconolactonase/glucosamine-6-phosphate isomerase/deaminase